MLIILLKYKIFLKIFTETFYLFLSFYKEKHVVEIEGISWIDLTKDISAYSTECLKFYTVNLKMFINLQYIMYEIMKYFTFISLETSQ